MRNEITELINKELKSANIRYGKFNSAHEGYAVMLEELEETEIELNTIKSITREMWNEIKKDYDTKEYATRIYNQAIYLIEEAIQVSAMAKKMLLYLEDK